jgi:guanyl-specific ribonuclease Sa
MAKRPPTSEAQRAKLRAAQLNYVANDPRWAEHRRKLGDAQRKPAQRATLSTAMRSYMDNDPRWPDHRARMMDAAVEATKLTLLPEEVVAIVELRKKGRNFEYIAEEFGIGDKVLRRELRAHGYTTGRVKSDKRARRRGGFWRCFD